MIGKLQSGLSVIHMSHKCWLKENNENTKVGDTYITA